MNKEETKLMLELVKDRIGAWLDSEPLSKDEQEELDMLYELKRKLEEELA
jgi:hypothetical protein